MCMHAWCVHWCTCLCVYACVCACACVYMHVCMGVYVHVCVWMCVCHSGSLTSSCRGTQWKTVASGGVSHPDHSIEVRRE